MKYLKHILLMAAFISTAAQGTDLKGDIAQGGLVWGTKATLSGQSPDWRAFALSPANAQRLTQELAQMRGAAMKVGQMLSMDAGDVLPAEFSTILSRLRSDAQPMPPRQLKQVLNAQWGEGWLKRFKQFGVRPIAAASIGQVHRAVLPEGQELAIKVQFPGIRDSINSDVDNVGQLLRLSGLLPKGFDLKGLLEEAKAQLHDEADYQKEAQNLQAFSAYFEGREGYRVPGLFSDLSSSSILAMDFLASEPLDILDQAQDDTPSYYVERLFALLFEEVFAFKRIQSDPNMANYRIAPEERALILLDFGSVRSLSDEMVAGYHALLQAGQAADRKGLESAAFEIGYLTDKTSQDQANLVLDLLEMACEPLRAKGGYDFGQSDLVNRLREVGMKLSLDANYREIPPINVLHLHRKFAGLFLMAKRFKTRLDLELLLKPYL